MTHPLRYPILPWLLLGCLFFFTMQPSFARTWTDIRGRTIDAEMVSTDGKTVELRSNKTGKEITISLDQLVIQDRAEVLMSLVNHSRPPAMDPAKPQSPLPDNVRDFRNLEESENTMEGTWNYWLKQFNPSNDSAKETERNWPVFFFTKAIVLLSVVLLSALGIYLISLIRDFNDGFGSALLVGIGTTGLQTLLDSLTTLSATIGSGGSPWSGSYTLLLGPVLFGVTYFFDVFLIRRIYREELATAVRSALFYYGWRVAAGAIIRMLVQSLGR